MRISIRKRETEIDAETRQLIEAKNEYDARKEKVELNSWCGGPRGRRKSTAAKVLKVPKLKRVKKIKKINQKKPKKLNLKKKKILKNKFIIIKVIFLKKIKCIF